jgi:hypothetical protein
MRHFGRLFFALLGISSLSTFAHAQQLWSSVLSPGRAINWSNAGAAINDSRTQCKTAACMTVSNGTTVTSASINSAIASMSANQYLLIPAGTWNLSGAIYCDVAGSCNNLTLEGAGANSTFLVFAANSGGPALCANHDVCFASSDQNYWAGPSNTANWTAGYPAGTTSITLNAISGTAPVVGQPIVLDQIDSQSDNGGLYVGCEIGSARGGDSSPACYSQANPGSYERGTGSLSTIRGQEQIVEVTSISGSGTGPYTVGITPGIYAGNWNSGQSPGAWWASHPAYGDAVENMSLDHTNAGASTTGIAFFNCQGCWVKGVRSVRGSTTNTGWGHVTFYICNHCTVRDSYFWGYSGDSYGVAVDSASDALIENNIAHYFASGTSVFASDCEGCVLDYNFSPGVFSTSAGWQGVTQELHAIALYSLTEGNIGPGYYGDSFHGTHDLNTLFRNRFDGREQNNGSLTTGETVPVRLNPGDRYENVIGNILGTWNGSNVYHKTYESTPSSFANLLTSVYAFGVYPETYTGGFNCKSGCAPVDSLSQSTTLLWGNYDVKTNAVRWCGNSSDTGWSTTCGSTSEIPTSASGYPNTVPTQGDTGAGQSAMPSSFVYSSKPSWWPSGKAWPIIGPDVTSGNVGQCYGGTYSTMEVTASQSSQCTAGGGSFTVFPTVVSNAAMDCYFNTMGGPISGGGSALSFTCGAGSTGSPGSPGSPINLTGTANPTP